MFKLSILILSFLLLLSFGTTSILLAEEVEQPIMFEWDREPSIARLNWIGVIQGTWREMGIQYGQRAAKDIATNFDIRWGSTLKETRRPWEDRPVNEKMEYLLKYIRKSYEELSYLSSEIIEFLEGISIGAAHELDQAKYADVCSNFEKIAILNFGNLHLHPDYGFVQDDDCSGFWVTGDATKGDLTIAVRSEQETVLGGTKERQVAYVAIPRDPNARVFWAHGGAGFIGGIGGGVMNDRGVGVLTAGSQSGEAYKNYADETVAPGIKDFLLAFYGVVFSESASEAAKKITVGTPKYRSLTGRDTVLRARGSNVVFVDPNEAYVVESNSHHYAIRRPGYLGEKDYIVYANHFACDDGSYDENNIFHSDEPMTMYTPNIEGNSSYYRFWTYMWDIKKNYGNIDVEMVKRDLVTAHYAYDEDGNLAYDVDPETGAPTAPGTVCSHSGSRSEKYPLGTGGDGSNSVMVLSSLEVYYNPGFPCHYKDKEWNYVNLKIYSDYRKMLWGY